MKRLAVVALMMTFAAGCAPRTGATTAEGAPPIAKVHATKCGNCHTRVEPGQKSREELEDALARHHKRVTLTDGEWRAMIDYLARRDAQAKGPVR